MKNPFLIGDKIYLRPIEVEDTPKYVEWLNDGDVTRTLGRGAFPLNLDREKEWVEKLYKDNDSLTLAIVIKEIDKLIGGTGFNKIERFVDGSYKDQLVMGILEREQREVGMNER